MSRTFVSLLAVLATALTLTSTPSAQEPKLGRDYYEDSVDIGFRVKAIKDWDFIPPTPNERNIIGKYAPPNSQYIMLSGGAALFLNVWMVKFDRRDGRSKGAKDIQTWMSDRIDEGRGWRPDGKKPKDLSKKVGLPAKAYVYEGLSNNGAGDAEPQPIQAYVSVFEISDDLEVAIVGIGPGGRKWRTYEKTYSAMAKTFRPVEIEGLTNAAPVGNDPRSKKRAKLQLEAAKTEGWVLVETPNYFIISSYDDKQFLAELQERLEGIRAVLERDYPASQARQKKREGPNSDSTEEIDEKEQERRRNRSISTVDSMALSRTSVVRVCKDRDEYMQYGAPGGSAGYWSSRDEELVVYDARKTRGREFTWGVLSHEAFHQYIFYFYGSLAPHSWYNEGTGDYYFGHQYKFKKFKQAEAKNRLSMVQGMFREGRTVPLREFVRWTQREYYGSNDRGVSGLECYAQGWSLIWFLRTGEKGKAPGWQRSWGKILEKYLATLADTGDLDEAIDVAFAGVDWDAFEKSWAEYTK